MITHPIRRRNSRLAASSTSDSSSRGPTYISHDQTNKPDSLGTPAKRLTDREQHMPGRTNPKSASEMKKWELIYCVTTSFGFMAFGITMMGLCLRMLFNSFSWAALIVGVGGWGVWIGCSLPTVVVCSLELYRRRRS